MKVLIVATAATDVAFSIKKIQELSFLQQQNSEVYLCLLGAKENEQVAMPHGLTKVLCLPPVEEAAKQNSMYLPPLFNFCKSEKIAIILFYSNKLGHSLAVMLSEKLNCECFTEIKELEQTNRGYEISRKVYDSNIDSIFPCNLPVVATLARGNCKVSPVLSNFRTIKMGDLGDEPDWVINSKCLRKNLKSSLEAASLIFVAGRGLGSKNNVTRLMALAIRFDASFGATRSIILNGWAPLEAMVGQSGTITSPDVVITFGVSGAGPFIVGIEQAKTIIAINNDTSAAIFHTAMYGIIADCNEILTALEKS